MRGDCEQSNRGCAFGASFGFRWSEQGHARRQRPGVAALTVRHQTGDVKTVFPLLGMIIALIICGCDNKQMSDSAIRLNLVGTWSVTLIDLDGSARPSGTFTVSANSGFQTDVITQVSNEVRRATVQGFVRVEDACLVKTITNILVHWRPESSRTGDVTLRTKILYVSDHKMVTETNEFGSVLYTKIR